MLAFYIPTMISVAAPIEIGNEQQCRDSTILGTQMRNTAHITSRPYSNGLKTMMVIFDGAFVTAFYAAYSIHHNGI